MTEFFTTLMQAVDGPWDAAVAVVLIVSVAAAAVLIVREYVKAFS